MNKVKLIIFVSLFSSSLVCMQDYAGAASGSTENKLSCSKRKESDSQMCQGASAGKFARSVNPFDLLPDDLVDEVFSKVGHDNRLMAMTCKRFNKLDKDALNQSWAALKNLPSDSWLIPNIINVRSLQVRDFRGLYCLLCEFIGDGFYIDREIFETSDKAACKDFTDVEVLKGLELELCSAVSSEFFIDLSGYHILSLFAGEGYVDMVKILLDKGVAVDVLNEDGETPLFQAASRGHIETVRLLLERGADVNHTSDESDESAYGMALKNDHKEIVELLLANGAIVR